MIRKAASSLRAVKSLPFVFTMSITCLRVTLPTLVLLGSLEPAAVLAAFFNKIAAARHLDVHSETSTFPTRIKASSIPLAHLFLLRLESTGKEHEFSPARAEAEPH